MCRRYRRLSRAQQRLTTKAAKATRQLPTRNSATPKRLEVDSSTRAKEIVVQVFPLVVLIDRHARVDERHRHLVQRRIDLSAGRDELALRDDRLSLRAQLEIVEEDGRVRMRGVLRHADAVRPRDGIADREPVDR